MSDETQNGENARRLVYRLANDSVGYKLIETDGIRRSV